MLVRFKYALPALGISICLLEVSYPIFIWIKKTRRVWLICILTMHAAIGLLMGLYLFALVMIVLNLAAFGANQRIWKPRFLLRRERADAFVEING
jgi:hypothetical protein